MSDQPKTPGAMVLTKPKPNNAPTYMCLYPGLATIARTKGYALAVHGSLARDMDLIAVPWVETPATPEELIAAIESEYGIRRIGKMTISSHGRIVQTIGIQFGECFIDLSFMPVVPGIEQTPAVGGEPKIIGYRIDTDAPVDSGYTLTLNPEAEGKYQVAVVDFAHVAQILAEIATERKFRMSAEGGWREANRVIAMQRERLDTLEARLAKANDWSHLKPDMDPPKP